MMVRKTYTTEGESNYGTQVSMLSLYTVNDGPAAQAIEAAIQVMCFFATRGPSFSVSTKVVTVNTDQGVGIVVVAGVVCYIVGQDVVSGFGLVTYGRHQEEHV
jgi:hypothetical protein